MISNGQDTHMLKDGDFVCVEWDMNVIGCKGGHKVKATITGMGSIGSGHSRFKNQYFSVLIAKFNRGKSSGLKWVKIL